MTVTKVGEKIPQPPAIEHTKGLIWIGMLLYLGVSYYCNLPVTKAIMAGAGAIQGYLYGTSS